MADAAQPGDALAVELAAMARELMSQRSLQSTLDAISEYAVRLVKGCDAAGILTVRRRAVRTLSATDTLVERSDQLQAELDEGPCFDAFTEHEQVLRIADLEQGSDRWPRFVPRARELGIRSMIGFLLFTDEQDLGSLNLYSRTPGALDERAELVGWLLASHASVAFAAARTDAGLNDALRSRTEIGQATGIIMERRKVTDDDAFALLVKASQTRNVKLREIARHVVETGELPAAEDAPPQV